MPKGGDSVRRKIPVPRKDDCPNDGDECARNFLRHELSAQDDYKHAGRDRNGGPTCCTHVLKRGNQFRQCVVKQLSIDGETFSFGYAQQSTNLTARDLDANAGEETNKYGA